MFCTIVCEIVLVKLFFVCRCHSQDQKEKHSDEGPSDDLRNQNESNSNSFLDDENFPEEQTQIPDIPMEVNLDSFEANSKEIFEELFAEIMKVKILHSLPNQALDSLLKALTLASTKSNTLFKKKLQEAIENLKRALSIQKLKNQAKSSLYLTYKPTIFCLSAHLVLKKSFKIQALI